MNNLNLNKKRGLTILETLLYVSFFAILSIVVINSMITMMKSFKEIKIQSELVQGSSIMERISREVRQSKSIFSINTGNTVNLKLNTTDEAGIDKTVQFILVGDDIQFINNNDSPVNLNPLNVIVSGLSFSQINTTKGSAVKITLTVKSVHDTQNRAVDFYDTVVLRGDY